MRILSIDMLVQTWCGYVMNIKNGEKSSFIQTFLEHIAMCAQNNEGKNNRSV